MDTEIFYSSDITRVRSWVCAHRAAGHEVCTGTHWQETGCGHALYDPGTGACKQCGYHHEESRYWARARMNNQ